MQLKPSAHADSFARDHLPPAEQWPELVFPLPGLRYPDRLNCGAELLDATVERFGAGRPALHTDAGETWSYGELQRHTDRIAHVLTDDLGVLPGNRVLLRGPTTPWLVACWLAVMKAGAVAVTVLAAQRAHELRGICEIAQVRHALCDARALDDLARAEVADLTVVAYGGEGSSDLLRLADSKPDTYAPVETSGDDVALIAFTSGTTGRPKGCVHFHRDVLAIADTFSEHVLRPVPDDVFAGSPPLGFTFGLGGLVVFPMRAGASALLLEQAGPDRLLPAVAEHRVSVLFTAPTAYRAMLDKLGAYDIGSLRRCVSAGRSGASAPDCGSSTGSAPPRCCTSSSPRPTTTPARDGRACRCPGTRRGSWTRPGPRCRTGSRGCWRCAGPRGAGIWPTSGSGSTCGAAGTSPATRMCASPTGTSGMWRARTT
jgi:2-aminobenzoate-CoA ligase